MVKMNIRKKRNPISICVQMEMCTDWPWIDAEAYKVWQHWRFSLLHWNSIHNKEIKNICSTFRTFCFRSRVLSHLFFFCVRQRLLCCEKRASIPETYAAHIHTHRHNGEREEKSVFRRIGGFQNSTPIKYDDDYEENALAKNSKTWTKLMWWFWSTK